MCIFLNVINKWDVKSSKHNVFIVCKIRFFLLFFFLFFINHFQNFFSLGWYDTMKFCLLRLFYRPQEESPFPGYHLAYEVKKLMYDYTNISLSYASFHIFFLFFFNFYKPYFWSVQIYPLGFIMTCYCFSPID